MKSRFSIPSLKPKFALLVALAAVILTPITTEAKSAPFSRIIVLGDSLSDTGNFFRLSGGLPPPPHFEGRFCNGQLWVEYLARGLGMKVTPSDNYAVVGATTGSFNLNNGLNGRDYPGLQQQVDDLLAANPHGLDRKALFVLWAGANDFFLFFGTGGDPAAMISSAVQNTVQAIQRLSAAGARHIMVPNLPDIGLTPSALESGQAPTVTQLAATYNSALAGALKTLQNSGISIVELDTFTIFQGMVTYAPLLGFKNVTDSFLPAMEGDVRHFLFWDSVHPTTRAHQVLSAVALLELIDHIAPRNASGHANVSRAIIQPHSSDF